MQFHFFHSYAKPRTESVLRLSSQLGVAFCKMYRCAVHCNSERTVRIILGFRDHWLRQYFVHDLSSRKIPPDLEVRLFRKLQLLDDATSDADLRVPPSNHF